MQVIIKSSFKKDVNSINEKSILLKLQEIIKVLKILENFYDVTNCKKLKGSENYYRIRIGNYRIGFKLEDNSIVLLRFLHRKEIYRYFP